MMDNKIIEEIVKDIRGEKISFLLGSGISINSGIPMVGGVKDNSIIDGIETYILSKLGFSIDDISKFINTIPFETFFEVLIDNGLDMNTFIRVFESKPSFIHNTVAKFAQKGLTNSIATTNFDECIEKALDELKIGYNVHLSEKIGDEKQPDVTVRKFHGSIEDVHNLVISVKRITNRIGYDRRKNDIDDFIKDSNCIIVCGYSCSDIFDLTPVFRSFKPCATKKIIYISHSNNQDFEIINDKNILDYRKVNNMFGNYDLTIVRGDTDAFMKQLSAAFNVVSEQERKYKTKWKCIIDECLDGFNLYQKYKTCGNLCFKINENKKSIDYWYKAHDVSDTESDKIACIRSIAWTYIYEKNYRKALDMLLPFSKSSQEKVKEHFVHYANIFSFLGVCYTILKPDEAENYYLRSLEICEEYRLKREEGYVLINYAELYDEINSIDKSIELTNRALDVMDKEGYIDTVGICHSNLACYYYTKGVYQMAHDNISKAIDIAMKLGENNLNNRIIIKNAIEIKQFIEQRMGIIRELQTEIGKGNNVADKANCNYLEGELLHMAGQTKEAVECWEKAKVQYDKLNMKSLFGEINEKRLKEHSINCIKK